MLLNGNQDKGSIPNCTLTKHELFRRPSGELILEGPTLTSSDDLEALFNKVNNDLIQNKKIKNPLPCSCFGHSSMGGIEQCHIDLNSADYANIFMDKVNEFETKRINEAPDGSDVPPPLDVYFKSVRNGPQWISKYDQYSEEVFGHFVAGIEQLEVFYENLYWDDKEAWKKAGIEENYWNTKATYKITMTDPAYLDHLKVGETWDGR